jgi:sugar transferase (PEP-CTERM system associated)
MPILFNRYYSTRNLVFFAVEGVLIFLSVIFVCWLFKGTSIFLIDLFDSFRQALVVTIAFQVSLYFFDLYDLSIISSLSEVVTRIVQAFGFGCIALALVYYIMPDLLIPSITFWAAFLLICLSVFLLRALYFNILRKRLFAQVIIVIGTGRLASDIAREVEGRSDSGYKVLGFIGGGEPSFNPKGAPVYPAIEDLQDYLFTEKISRIVVAPDDRRGHIPVHMLIHCKMRGIAIDQGVTFYERISGKVLVERVDPSWIFFSDGFGFSRWRRLLKCIMDVSIAVPLFVVSLPVVLLSALIIKLESPGPVLYSQERVGERNRTFKLIKLRSMRQDAEVDGPVWAQEQDERVTRFGAFIRKTRIDELPQLWNVIKGEMSLVGPRPERPVFVDQLVKEIPYYNIRHATKPGITGWAQVCYHYGASREDALRKLEYDLYYLKNTSIPLDLFIIFKTIKTILFQEGSR